jgi:hypothetical protein
MNVDLKQPSRHVQPSIRLCLAKLAIALLHNYCTYNDCSSIHLQKHRKAHLMPLKIMQPILTQIYELHILARVTKLTCCHQSPISTDVLMEYTKLNPLSPGIVA